MKRRLFLQGTLAGAALAAGTAATAQATPEAAPQSTTAASAGAAAPQGAREYYLLRRYRLTHAQAGAGDRYLSEALFPALQRLGFSGTGAFALEYGPETPTTYLLLRHSELDLLMQLNEALATDEAFVKAASAYQAAPAAQPAFERIDDTLLHAFTGWPVLQAPARAHRILQLRTYESQSEAAHLRKVEMFHSGEFDIFRQCGMHQVFYGQTIAGDRMPNLTYMLSHDSLADMDTKWNRFRTNPEWKKLSTTPRFSYEDLVSKITNLVLSPKPYSQV